MTDPSMDLKDQIEYYRRKYELNPHARVFAPLADLYRKAGRLDEALLILKEGLQHHPRYISALVILGKCQRDAGDMEAARETFDQVLLLDPDNLVVLKLLAEHAAQRQDWRTASGFLARVVLLDPTDEPAESELGRIRASHGDLLSARAIEADHDATQRARSETSITAPAASEQPESAQRPAAGAKGGGPPPVVPSSVQPDLRPDTAPGASETQALATKTLADIYLAQGYRDKALDVLRQILTRHPDREDVRRKIADLEGADRAVAKEQPAPAAELSPALDPAPETVAGQANDRQQFTRWLDKISRKPEDGNG
jgi:tetratricopeptide (TPR) repeat protein